jgi:hypothetical protein
LAKLEIKSPDHLAKILVEEEEFRNTLDARHKINSKRYHSVYVLSIKHKLSAQLSYMYFVKIAGSEKPLKTQ